MGNRMLPPRRQGEALSVFDIAALIVQSHMPITPMTVPACLDELVDWADEATLTVNYLARAGVNVLVNADTDMAVCFTPLILTGTADANGESCRIFMQ